MNKVIIATIGTRDIQLKEDYFNSDNKIVSLQSYLDKDKEGKYSKTFNHAARQAGEIIVTHYQQLAPFLCLPILEPTLKHLQTADKLILVATNQPTAHHNDTLYFAQIAQKWIMQHYTEQYTQIDILEVNTSDVIRLDSMYDYFAKSFNQEPLKSIEQANEIHLHLVGGIDAINNALRLSCMYLYPEKLQPELQVNEKDASVISVKSFSRFLNAQNLRLAEKFAKHYDYAAISQLNIPKPIRLLAQYTQHRLAFNFEKCKAILHNNKNLNEDLRKELINQVNFDKNNTEAYIKELYHNLHIKYQQENYVDFLSRIFRLYEAYLNNQVLKISGIKYTQSNWKESFEIYLHKNPDLEDFLKNPIKASGKTFKLKYLEDNPSTLLLYKILEYFAKNNLYDDKNLELLNTIEKLAGIRNKSIAAHDFKAVSKEKIDAKIKPLIIDDFFEKLKQLLEINENPIEILNKKIEEQIQRSLTYG